MKRLMLGIIFLALAATAADEPRIMWRFVNSPLEQVLEFYTRLSGKPVEIPVGVNALVTSKTINSLPHDAAIRILEEELQNNLIGIITLPDGRLQAAAIKLSKLTVTNYPLNLALAQVGAMCDMRIVFDDTLTNRVTVDYPDPTPAPKILRFLISEMANAGLELIPNSNGVYTVEKR